MFNLHWEGFVWMACIISHYLAFMLSYFLLYCTTEEGKRNLHRAKEDDVDGGCWLRSDFFLDYPAV